MKYRDKQKEFLLSEGHDDGITLIPPDRSTERGLLHSLTIAQLHARGIETITEVHPAITSSQKHQGSVETADGMNITRTYIVVAKTADELAAEDAMRIISIKLAARHYILARYPDWKQANMTAAMLEMVNKKLTTALTADEQAMQTNLMAAWAWVKAVRTASDVAEAQGIAADVIVWPG